jgi:hypothetical protein
LILVLVANNDGTFTISFEWSAATGDTAFNFLTTKQLGTASRRGMGCYLRAALKSLVKLRPSAQHSAYFSGMLKSQKNLSNAGKNLECKRHFLEAFAQSRVGLVDAMIAYMPGHPAKFYAVRCIEADDGRLIPHNHLPTHGDINTLARVCVLMSEPQVQHARIAFNDHQFTFHAHVTGARTVARHIE